MLTFEAWCGSIIDTREQQSGAGRLLECGVYLEN
nr:MAG TPA: hypothetical protein [Caudoviricetes sp.]